MVNRLLDAELAPQGIASLVLHPGSVLTRMNSDDSDVKPPGEGSTITPRDSVSGINRYPCTHRVGENGSKRRLGFTLQF